MNYETLPPPLILTDISKSIQYARHIRQTDPGKFEYARQILLTHLPLHENITEAIQSIITEYSLDYNTRMLFIGVAESINQNK